MKKIVKIAGNILMLIALAFLVQKFIEMNVDFSLLKSAPVITALLFSFAIQTLIVVMGCFPWLVFTESLSGTKIKFSTAMPVYTKSNIYKYLPGNVFQYIGRNKLAADMNISHIDVACATILDVFFCVLSTGVISIILLGEMISDLLNKYGSNLLTVGIVAIVVVISLIILLYFKFKSRFKSYIARYAKAFAPANRSRLFQGIGYYFLQNCISAVMYFVTLRLVFGNTETLSNLVELTGAFMFAWIVGFVTPGAPGGIGIRESVMLFVCGKEFESSVILFVLVLRISSILADISAFIIGNIYQKSKMKSLKQH